MKCYTYFERRFFLVPIINLGIWVINSLCSQSPSVDWDTAPLKRLHSLLSYTKVSCPYRYLYDNAEIPVHVGTFHYLSTCKILLLTIELWCKTSPFLGCDWKNWTFVFLILFFPFLFWIILLAVTEWHKKPLIACHADEDRNCRPEEPAPLQWEGVMSEGLRAHSFTGRLGTSIVSTTDFLQHTNVSNPSALAIEERHVQLWERKEIMLFPGCSVNAETGKFEILLLVYLLQSSLGNKLL